MNLPKAAQIGDGRGRIWTRQSGSRVCVHGSDGEHTEETSVQGAFCLSFLYSSLPQGAGSPAGETDVRGGEPSMVSVANRTGLWIGLPDLVSHLKWAGQKWVQYSCN